jgi:hypothetical protein
MLPQRILGELNDIVQLAGLAHESHPTGASLRLSGDG